MATNSVSPEALILRDQIKIALSRQQRFETLPPYMPSMQYRSFSARYLLSKLLLRFVLAMLGMYGVWKAIEGIMHFFK